MNNHDSKKVYDSLGIWKNLAHHGYQNKQDSDKESFSWAQYNIRAKIMNLSRLAQMKQDSN